MPSMPRKSYFKEKNNKMKVEQRGPEPEHAKEKSDLKDVLERESVDLATTIKWRKMERGKKSHR